VINVGLIGYGYWGPNLARNIRRCAHTKLVRIADRDPKRLESIHREWSDVDVSTEADAILKADDIEAVVIATPISTHYKLALEALRHGKHVLVEKPMAESVRECEHLMEEAAKRKLLLMVDHTFLFTEAVGYISRFMESGELGELYYYDSIRANLGLFQRDASVLWDLAPHDLSILIDLVRRDVRSVSATGACHAGSRVPDIVYLTLDMGDGCLAHFHASWLSPVKVRRTLIAGSRRMIIFDDLETSEKIKIYDNGVKIEHHDVDGEYRMKADYRIGDVMCPALSNKEALASEMNHFADCIRGRALPRSGAESGLEVVRILEAAELSMRSDGKKIPLTGMPRVSRPALPLRANA
jgi:predicted dehydrogenase